MITSNTTLVAQMAQGASGSAVVANYIYFYQPDAQQRTTNLAYNLKRVIEQSEATSRLATVLLEQLEGPESRTLRGRYSEPDPDQVEGRLHREGSS